MNYEKDVTIDPECLDVEWLRQAHIYMEYAQEAAKLDAIVKQKKEVLDVVDAQIDRDIRSSSDKKPTEAQIRSEILLDPAHQKANQEYIEALYDYNICIAAVKAMEHKKSALENLVRLWQGSYFAGPREPRDLSDMANWGDKIESSARDQIRNRLNNKLNNNQ